MALIEGCDLACALPGGPGTLTEISLMWNLLLTHSIAPRRLILIGKGWELTFQTFLRLWGLHTRQPARYLTFAPDIDAAAGLISTA